MIAYIDSSVLLRVALKQSVHPSPLSSVSLGASSRLLKAECLRTIDRLRMTEKISLEDQLSATEYIYNALERLEIIGLNENILERVGQPAGFNLGTLDAIHLFSALVWRDTKSQPVHFLTHDISLGKAARLCGFSVLGVPEPG